jgi:Fe-S cluster biogenesis protein NfuA
MRNTLVHSFIKEDENFARFEFNINIGISEPRKYNSVEETKDAPLAQQMFYLPFVKSVQLFDNGIELERFDILDWKDVIEEVTKEIQNYLNQDGEIIKEQVTKKVPVTVYAESTPNPSVMKFVANKTLVSKIHEFKKVEDTISAPMIQELFFFPFVGEVFVDANYLSITKKEGIEWDAIAMEVREFIRQYLEQEKPIVLESVQENKNVVSTEIDLSKLDQTSQEIVKIIEDYIKPAVASDGGNILFDSYNTEDKSVQVVLQGACSGCPSSTFTLKNGIENMLKEMLPGKVASVTALNG